MEHPDSTRLNPDIKEVKIGVRRLRKIKVYPLSAADQFKMSDLITEGLKTFMASEGQTDVAVVSVILELVRDNIGRVLELVTDEKDRGENILEDLTNNQIVEIADVIYEVNYAALQKKLTSLLEKLVPNLPASLSRRSSQPSSGDTPSTNSNITSEEPLEMEVSPSDKSE